jgi:2-oxoisovalerate dehydrogenase E1 component
VSELSKSCYLSAGQFPIQSLIRIPIGAYGGGGPYHSGSIESTLLTIRGIKIVYPSNAADMKGLMKAAFVDPNPVIMLEHKGLYWSKVPGTEEAKSIEPSEDYIIPLGKANVVLAADSEMVDEGATAVVITYGMGVYWAMAAGKQLQGRIEIVDLRTLNPIDYPFLIEQTKRHGKVLILTEEPLLNSFAESLAGRLSQDCFRYLDGPIVTLGAAPVPAIPIQVELEKVILPNAEKVLNRLKQLLES